MHVLLAGSGGRFGGGNSQKRSECENELQCCSLSAGLPLYSMYGGAVSERMNGMTERVYVHDYTTVTAAGCSDERQRLSHAAHYTSHSHTLSLQWRKCVHRSHITPTHHIEPGTNTASA